MAVRLGDAVLFLGTDDSALESGLDKAEHKTSAWGSALQGVMAGVGIAVAGAVVGLVQSGIAQIGGLVDAASNMSETISKTNVIFDDSAKAILAWSDTASASFGQSKQQALDAATVFATFGKSAGLGGDDLVDFSTNLTQLASDLASFNNTSPEQAINAIGAALRGESEPLRSYGVLLDDATLKAAAFAMGLTESNTATLTAQQKVLAAQRVIFDQTKDAQGDFARTSEGLANSQRSSAAAWEDFRVKLGSVFLPVVEQVMGMIGKLSSVVMPMVEKVIEQNVVPAVQAFSTALGNFVNHYGPLVRDWVMGIVGHFKKFWEATAETREKGLKSIGGLLQGIWNFAVSVGALVGQIIKSLGDLMAWFVFNDAGELRGWAKVVYAIFFGIIDTVTLVIDTISRLAEAMTAVLRGDWSGALYALTRYNGSTAGMVPLLDANGNRIGWQSAEQAGLNAGTVQQNSASSIVNTVNVNITTAAADPAQVGRDLSRAVQDALRAGGYS